MLIACFVLLLAASLSFLGMGIPSFVGSPIALTVRFARDVRGSLFAAAETFADGVRGASHLAGENRVLREQLNALESALERMKRETEEDRALLLSLGRSPSPGERVVGEVIAKPGVLPYDLVLIDIGRDVGVAPGELVFAAGDVPIGTVAEATSHTAKVRLFSSSGEMHETLVGEHSLPATLRGSGGGAFTAELPRDSGLTPGALVFWPGPPVRAMGVIEKVEGDETDPFVAAYVRYLIPLFSLRWVEVEIGPSR